jgi:hypothetical protein
MRLSIGDKAVWSETAGYKVGDVVNNPSPVGIWVCIQNISAPPFPATNPNPTSSPDFWTELVASPSPTGTSMVYLNTFNPVLGYVAQSVVEYQGANYICQLATSAPGPNPNPIIDTAHWVSLTGDYLRNYNAFDPTGNTPYPIGSMVSYDGFWWIRLTLYIPPTPVVALPPPSLTNTDWSFFSPKNFTQNIIALQTPYPVPPAIEVTEQLPFPPFTTQSPYYSAISGSSGFVNGGTGVPLTPGAKYTVSYNLRFKGNDVPGTYIGVAEHKILLTFNLPTPLPSPLVKATSYYQIADIFQLDGIQLTPSRDITGTISFTAPSDATYIGLQMESLLLAGAFNSGTLEIYFPNPSGGLLLTTYA